MNEIILHGKVKEVLLMISVFKQTFGNITLKELADRLEQIKK